MPLGLTLRGAGKAVAGREAHGWDLQREQWEEGGWVPARVRAPPDSTVASVEGELGRNL